MDESKTIVNETVWVKVKVWRKSCPKLAIYLRAWCAHTCVLWFDWQVDSKYPPCGSEESDTSWSSQMSTRILLDVRENEHIHSPYARLSHIPHIFSLSFIFCCLIQNNIKRLCLSRAMQILAKKKKKAKTGLIWFKLINKLNQAGLVSQ